MADIELVIKLPKRVYNYIRKHEHIANSDRLDIKDAIANGTPLPKGHGKIVDANRVLENGDNWEVETALMQTEAIVEADTESEE